jgi:hypothetical protein
MQKGGSRAASGGGGAKHRKNAGGKRTPTECRRVAPGPLLVGVARKHVKIRGFWAAEIFYLPPTECRLGPICGIAFSRGSLKCAVEACSPQIVGLRSAVNSGVLE